MSGIELVLAFLAGVVMGGALDRFVLPFPAGVVMGGALDRFVLPLLVDAWIDRLRRHGR